MSNDSWFRWPKEAPAWLDLRRLNGRTPVAPLSSQQTAGRLEVSVQEMVGDLGGYTIPELSQALAGPWAFRFKICKVWRAMDSLRESGVYSLLDHHWLIFRLEPAQTDFEPAYWQPPRSAQKAADSFSQQGCQDEENGEASNKANASQNPTSESAKEGDSPPGHDCRLRRSSSSGNKRSGPEPESSNISKAAKKGEPSEESAKRLKEELEQRSPSSPSGQDPQNFQDTGALRIEPITARDTDAAVLDDTDGKEANLQPKGNWGLELANAGKTWFLRLDRFDEADKWFPCASFENALLTEQAREQHYRPRSDVCFEANVLFLDCLVPSLSRLSEIKYSVFAKGTHCQWHAKVVSCLAASQSYFIDRHSISQEHLAAVSQVLLDGREQANYTEVAKILSEGDGSAAASFVKRRPEAPFFKQCIQDLKDLANRCPDKVSCDVVRTPFPDIHFIYTALQEA